MAHVGFWGRYSIFSHSSATFSFIGPVSPRGFFLSFSALFNFVGDQIVYPNTGNGYIARMAWETWTTSLDQECAIDLHICLAHSDAWFLLWGLVNIECSGCVQD